MLKVYFFLKRKAGISHRQFREHMENSHVRLAQKHFSNLMLAYSRSHFEAATDGGDGSGPLTGYDCISEWTLADDKAFEEIMSIVTGPGPGEEFRADEEHFLDREATLVLTGDPVSGS